LFCDSNTVIAHAGHQYQVDTANNSHAQLLMDQTIINVKALVNHEHSYRLRVGYFRVFFDFDGSARIVLIEEVKKRDERTY
jgi:mRNA-degrading endonuclease RelE of RelBE toxin-antitoxin system